jgi:hypothetical protein
MIVLIFLLVYALGAAATFYGLIRWADMDPDGWDGETVYWLAGSWFFSLPLVGLFMGFWWCCEQLKGLAQKDAEKDKSNES